MWKITVLTLPEVCIFWNDTKRKRKRLKNAFVSIVRVQVKKKKKKEKQESQKTPSWKVDIYIYMLQSFNNSSDKVVRGIPIDK